MIRRRRCRHFKTLELRAEDSRRCAMRRRQPLRHDAAIIFAAATMPSAIRLPARDDAQPRRY